MKAVHVAWIALIPLIGTLFIEIGNLMQGHGDWNAIVAAAAGIITVFLPAAQLALPQFKPSPVKGNMPVLSVNLNDK